MKVRFRVVTAFKATVFALSGQERLFQPGDEFLLELGQHDKLVTIEADHTLYIADGSTVALCCISNSMGPSADP